MAYKKFFYRNGKKFGPYYYESYRDGSGKVKKKYMGTTDPDKGKKGLKKNSLRDGKNISKSLKKNNNVGVTKSLSIFLILGLVFLLILGVGFLSNGKSNNFISGFAINPDISDGEMSEFISEVLDKEEIVESFDGEVGLEIKEPPVLSGEVISENKNQRMEFDIRGSEQGSENGGIRLYFDLLSYSEFVESVSEEIVEDETGVVTGLVNGFLSLTGRVVEGISDSEELEDSNNAEETSVIMEGYGVEDLEDAEDSNIDLEEIKEKVEELSEAELEIIEEGAVVEAEDFEIVVSSIPDETEDSDNDEYKWGYNVRLNDLNFMAKIEVTSDEELEIYSSDSIKIGRQILSFKDLVDEGYNIRFEKPVLEVELDEVESISDSNESEDLENVDEINVSDDEIEEVEEVVDEINVTEEVVGNESEIEVIEEIVIDVENNVTEEVVGNESEIEVIEVIEEEEIEVEEIEEIEDEEVEEEAEEIIEAPKGVPTSADEGNKVGKEETIVESVVEVIENVVGGLFLGITGNVIENGEVEDIEYENTISVYIEKAFNEDEASVGDIIYLDPSLIIIPISGAEHLDSEKEFVSDIYDETRILDNVWSEAIDDGEYVRVTFKEELDNSRDITLKPRIVSGSPVIEVYEYESSDLIVSFDNIISNEYNQVLLKNLEGVQDVFDLKIVGGSVEFDHIVDAIILVQNKSVADAYSSPSTSITTTLDSAPTSGNLLVTAVGMDKSSGTITVPSGFTLVHDYASSSVSGAMAYKISNGSETSTTWSWVSSQEGTAWVGEYSGLATSGVLDVKQEDDSSTSSTQSQSTGTTAETSQADELAVAFVTVDSAQNIETGRAWTNSFIIQDHAPGLSGTPGLNVAHKILSSTGTVETTFSTSDTGDQSYAVVATFKAYEATAPNITFVAPTPDDSDTTENTSIEINASIISGEGLDEVKYSWDGINYTMHNDSLVLFMNFDNVAGLGESDGSLVIDLSANSNNGTPAGTAAATATAKYGGAYTFDGNSDYIDLQEPASLKLSRFTIMTWFRRTGNGVTATIGTGGVTDCIPLVTKGNGEADGDNRDANYAFCITDGTDVLAGDYEDSGGSPNNHPVLATTTIVNDVWYHGTLTYNGSDFSIYTNGVLEGTVYPDTGPRSDSIQDNAIASSLDSDGTPAEGFFQGQMDEVRIWNISLTAEEIAQQYMSNLNKYDTDKWVLHVNQSKNATTGLDLGSYDYFVSIRNSSGSENISETRTITIGNVDNAPSITLVSPSDASTQTNLTVVFNCSATDGEELANITLYGNWSGSWAENETSVIKGTSNSSSWMFDLGDSTTYLWNCYSCDNSSQCSWGSSNYTFSLDSSLDLVAPNVTLNLPSNGSTEVSTSVTFNCSSTDAVNLSNSSLYFSSGSSGEVVTVIFQEDGNFANHTNDTHLKASAATTNYGGVKLEIDGPSTIEHALISYPNLIGNGAGQVPLGSTIVSADLSLWNDNDAGDTPLIYIVIQDWTEDGATWNTYDGSSSWASAGGDYDTDISVTATGLGTINANAVMNVTEFVQNWSDGGPNYGFLFYEGGSSGLSIVESEEAGDATKRPKLTVAYIAPGVAWHLNETVNLGGTDNSTTFSKTLDDNLTYTWNCLSYDLAGNSNWSITNYTFDLNTSADESDNPPSVTLNSPANASIHTNATVAFNCSATDGTELANITLYGNWSGSWAENETSVIKGTSNSSVFNVPLGDGSNYLWNCYSCDNATNCSWAASNFSFLLNTSYSPIVFVVPTPTNASSTTNTSIEINVSITESDLDELIFNWNGSNFTLFNDSLILMSNFDNVSALGESSGIVDLAGGDKNGTIVGNALTTGKYGSAFNYDGNDYLSYGVLGALSDRSVGVWLKGTSWVYTGAWPNTVFAFNTAAGGNTDIVRFNTTGGVGYYSGATLQCTGSNVSISTGEWHHYLFVTDAGSSSKTYLDGNLVENCGSWSPSVNSDDVLFIGQEIDTATPSDHFDGVIDELRVWNRVLSAAEAKQLYFMNLNKYDSNKWVLYGNQSKNSTTGLDDASYNFQTFVIDGDSNLEKSDKRFVTVDGAVDNAPTTTLVSPADASTQTNLTIAFNCSAVDGTKLANITLYGNWSGSWAENETSVISGTSNSSSWNFNLSDNSNYLWNCYACDNASQCSWGSSNFSFKTDTSYISVDPFYDGISVGDLDNSSNWQEVSGLAITQNTSNTGFIWGQSDGSIDLLLAINLSDGSNAGEWTLSGINGVDYEDLSSATIGGVHYIYLADMGDNGDSRGTIIIYRIKEPTINGTNGVVASGDIETITCEYPGGGDAPSHQDAETLLVDPESGDMYIITKRESVPGVYSLAQNASYAGTQTLTFEGDMWDIPDIASTAAPGNAVGGDISPDGLKILVKSCGETFLFQRSDNSTSIFDTLNSTPVNLSSYVGGGILNYVSSHPSQEPQGEAVTFSRNSQDYFTASEFVSGEGSGNGYPLFRYNKTNQTVTTIVFQEGVSPNSSYAGTEDTYIWENENSSHGDAGTFVVDLNAADERKGLLKFNLSDIPSNATIIGARLDLNIGVEGQGWTFHRILSVDWNESSAYDDLPGSAGIDIDDVEVSSTEDNRNGVTLDTYLGGIRNNMALDTVQNWVNGSQENYGWLIKASHATDGQQFNSSESGISVRPRLTIRYIEGVAAPVDAVPVVNFVNPTLNNTSVTSNTFVEINASINDANLSQVIYNWNGANFTLFNDSLVLMMNFDNVSALGENDTHVVDVSGGGNNGTLGGTARANVSGKFGSALGLDGNSDYAEIVDSSSLDIGTNSMTIEAWVYPETFGSMDEIVKKDGAYILRLSGTSGAIEGYLWADTNGNPVGPSTNLLTQNAWNYVVMTYNTTHQQLFVNGVADATDPQIGNVDNSAINLMIGSHQNKGSEFFEGNIDEVRIWNRSLSFEEIQQNYMSNLQKFNSSQWYLYVNQSLNSTDGLVNGNYTYNVFGIDESDGFGTSGERSVSIDNVVPVVGLVNPANNTLNDTTNTINFFYNVSDVSSISNCSLIINKVINSTVESPTKDQTNSISAILGSSGTYNWSVNCSDAGGNVGASEVRNLSVNYTAPVPTFITLNSPANGISDLVLGNVTLNWSILGVNKTEVFVNNNTNNLDTSLVYVRSGQANGSYTHNFSNFVLQSEDNLVALYHFDNRSSYGENSTYYYDFSGKGNNISCTTTCPDLNESGKLGGAMQFDGSSDYLSSGTTDLPNQPVNYSIEAWVFFDNVGAATYNIVWSRNSVAGNTLIMLLGPRNGNSLNVAHDISLYDTGFALSSQKWYHFVQRYNGTTLSVFADNVEIYTNSSVNAISTSTTCQILIGVDSDDGCAGSFGADYFDGMIDEFAFYNKSLSDAEISNHYVVGNGTYYWNANVTLENGSVINSGVRSFSIGSSADTSPSVTLVSPSNNGVSVSTDVNFNCSAVDGIELANITLYGNWSGSFVANETSVIKGVSNSSVFSVTLGDEAKYSWNCYACDNASQCSWGSSNFTIRVDTNYALNTSIIYPTNNANISQTGSIDLNWSIDDGNETWVYASNDSSNLGSSLIYHTNESGNNVYTYGHNWSGLVAQSSISDTIGLWNFDSSGTITNDETGNHNANCSNCPSFVEKGKFAGSFEFDGVDDYFEMPDSNDWDMPSWTIMGWFNMSGPGVNVNTGSGGMLYYPIISKGMAETETGIDDMAFAVGVCNESDATCPRTGLAVDFEIITNSTNVPLVGDTNLSFNEWYHFAAVYDNSTTTLKLYLNGKLDGSRDTFTQATQSSIMRVGIGTSFKTDNTTTGAWNGLIDNLVVINRSLSQAEIIPYYNLSAQKYYWNANVSNGSTNLSSGVYQFNLTQNYAPSMQLVNPAIGTNTENTSMNLIVNVSDSNGESVNVSFYGSEGVVANNFTIITLPDTQNMAENYPELFDKEMNWIVGNYSNLNGKIVLHLGDLVNQPANTTQWDVANKSMRLLDNNSIPYLVTQGNHDLIGDTDYTNFNLYFPLSRLNQTSAYSGSYINGNNMYSLMTIEGMKFGFLSLNYNPNNTVLAWANQTVSNFSDYRWIVFSHSMIQNDADCLTVAGSNIWNNFANWHSNVFMLLGGHVPGTYNCTKTGNSGNTVYGIVANYQSETRAGDGKVRYYTFDPNADKIYAYTYNTNLTSFDTDAGDQFVISNFSMNASSYVQLYNNASVPNNAEVNFTWTGLNNSDYYWYVNVSDGISTSGSAIWNFTKVAEVVPTVTLNLPANWANITTTNATFNCSVTNDGLLNVTLYGNWSGSFAENETSSITGTSNSSSWDLNLSNGIYSWNCYSCDSDGACGWGASNFTLNISVPLTPPNVTLVSPSDSSIQTNASIDFNCSVIEDINMKNISLYINGSGASGSELAGTDNELILYHLNNDSSIGESDSLIVDSVDYDNATFSGGAGFSTTKFLGEGSAEFADTGNDSIEINFGKGVNPSTNPFSIVLWANKTNTCNTGDDDHLFGSSLGTNVRSYIRCRVDNWAYRVQGNVAVDSGQAVQLNTWTHIGLVMNGTHANFYINGSLYNSDAYTSYVLGSNFMVGGVADGGAGGEQWGGLIDEFALYNRSLTSAEVLDIYNAQKGGLNLSESFNLNQTNNLTGTINSTIFSLTLPDNESYKWNCYGCDNDSQCRWGSSNFSFALNTSYSIPAPALYYGSGTESNGSSFERTWIYMDGRVVGSNFSNITFNLHNASGLVSNITTVNRTGFVLANYDTTVLDNSNLALDDDSSGLAYNPETGTIYVVHNNPPTLDEMYINGTLNRTITLSSFDDTEAVTYINTTGNYHYLGIAEEGRGNMSIIRINLTTTSVSFSGSDSTNYDLGLGDLANLGFEGLCYDSVRNIFYGVKEKSDMEVYRINLSAPTKVTELFDAEALLTVTDLSGCDYDENTETLFLLSHESQNITAVNLSGSKVGGFALPNVVQAEGLIFDNYGENMYVMGEGDFLSIFRTNNFSVSYNFTGLSADAYHYNISGVNTLGGVNSTGMRYLTLTEHIVPNITLVSPLNDSGNNGSIDFVFNVNSSINVTNCSLYFNGNLNQTNSSMVKETNTSFSLSGLGIAMYNWSIRCYDNVSNFSNSDNLVFAVVDTEEFNGETTNFTQVNMSNITNLVLDNPAQGVINFTESIDLSNGANFTDHVNVSFNRIEINSTALPSLNAGARLSLYNLTFTTPRILKDNAICSDCTEVSYSGGTLVFDVTGFSVYSAEETPVSDVAETTSTGGGGGGGLLPTKRVVSEGELVIKNKFIDVFTGLGLIKTREIEIYNDRSESVGVDLRLENLEDILFIDKNELNFELGGYEKKIIIARIVAPELAGIYEGIIEVNDGEKQEIKVAINVNKKELLFDAKITIPWDYRLVKQGSNLESQIDLIPMVDDARFDVTTNYIIKNFEGKSFLKESETFLIDGQKSFNKEFMTNTLPLGEYVLELELIYPNGVAVSHSSFEVREGVGVLASISNYRLVVLLLVLSVLILVIAIILIDIRYKKLKLHKK